MKKKIFNQPKNILTFLFVTSAILLLSVVYLAISDINQSRVTTLTLLQNNPNFINHPIGTSGSQVGDTASFEAPLLQGNKVVGELTGSRTLIETFNNLNWTINDKSNGSINGLKNDMWLNTMIFNIFGKGTIIVEGQRLIPTDSKTIDFPQISANDTESVAIIGGTGDYKFAHGQLTTTKNSDGTYIQLFTMHLK